MWYYQDKNSEYYYLHIDHRWIYKDRIFKLNKNKRSSSIEEFGSPSARLHSDGVKAYFDEWFGKLLANNQVCEDRIMGQN